VSGDRPLVAGNWKMHKLRDEAAELAGAIAVASDESTGCDVAVFPPYTALEAVRVALGDSRVLLGGQACHAAGSGAHTGEIAAAMLRDAGCALVLCGHSERRAAGEGDEDVGARVRAALTAGLSPILCVGETLDEREAGATDAVLTRQLTAGLAGLDAADLERLEVAYEPVWAIGTGRTATPEIASQAHAVIRTHLVQTFGQAGGSPRILYGGSVKPANAAELLASEGVSGVLVGGASLDADSFRAIMASA
jgi:triosephosphate isomerase